MIVYMAIRALSLSMSIGFLQTFTKLEAQVALRAKQFSEITCSSLLEELGLNLHSLIVVIIELIK